MRKLQKKILTWLLEESNRSVLLHLAILIGVFAVVLIANFPFSSWYTGWDNLHPEFNFFLNFKRGLSAVWQENQGLGTIGGHGYAATLPHTLFLYLMSFFLPLKYLRSSFTFLMLFLGPLGVFFFTRKILQINNSRWAAPGDPQPESLTRIGGRSETESAKIDASATIASLFYMLNFATIQQFYIPLEAFIIHFTTLPWMLLAVIVYLDKKTRKNMLFLAVIAFLSSPQGFIPPLFLATLIIIAFMLFFYLIQKRSLDSLKDASLIILILFCVNSYWLLPNLYYSAKRTSTYLNSYNNISSTEDFILKSKKYGKIANVILLESSLTESIDVSDKGEIFPIFEAWKKHFKSQIVLLIAAFLFILKLIGMVRFSFKKKYYYYGLFAGFIFFFLILSSDSFPFIYNFFQKIPLLRQSLRIPFTKFSFALAFSYSVALGLGSYTILNLFAAGRAGLSKIITIFLVLAILILSYPTFTGNLFYGRTKIEIPGIYFELFDFFKKQNPDARIANLPQGWSWGWSVYSWGYSGSGFLWYGVENPILDRSFDVWGAQNEQYYWELTHAIYSENFSQVDKIFDKYQVRFLVFDGNILGYPNVKSYLYSGRLQKYLENSPKYRLVKSLSSKEPNVHSINIYEVSLENPPDNFKKIVDLNKTKNIGPFYDFSHSDKAYVDYGQYYTSQNQDFEVYYPWRALFTHRKLVSDESQIQETPDSIILKSIVPENIDQYDFVADTLAQENPIAFYMTDESGKKEIVAKIPKNKIQLFYDSNDDYYFLHHKPGDCSGIERLFLKQEIVEGNILRFTSLNAENCHDIIFDTLPQGQAYLIEIDNRHLAGRPISFALINHNSKKSDLDLILTESSQFEKNFLLIPPMNANAVGYSLHFDNISIGWDKSINDLKNIKIWSFPYEILKSARFIPKTEKKKTGDKLLIYYQAFDPGWKTYVISCKLSVVSCKLAKYFPFIFGEEIKDHVLVNNWANGWQISRSLSEVSLRQPAELAPADGGLVKTNSTNSDQSRLSREPIITIVFLPQYLEFAGFGLLAFSLIWILVFKRK